MQAVHNIEINAIHNEQPKILLAPYQEADVAAIFPLDLQAVDFPPRHLHRYESSPAAIAALADSAYRTHWGIFEQEPVAANFIGEVSLADVNVGSLEDPVYTAKLRAVGTFVMRADKRGSGIGSLAKLGVIEHALSEGTHVLQADTSGTNLPAQRSLHKLGFSHVHNRPPGRGIPGVDVTQHWMLVRPESIAAMSANNPERQPLYAAGWQRYANFKRAYTVTVNYSPVASPNV